ncbi:potassium/proton antiporter [Perlabentimonas gracilis]|uniref:potassium/proton antiporter n=1 Tax=Perlabentimonas gracilis TaxID=2715279 RepID=UPI001409CCEB|nr:potassium/proton antiporter [Perlabentimonas gracilis]NHB67433.1 potassium/proton antiporter [Perlabentimonas gracilis]
MLITAENILLVGSVLLLISIILIQRSYKFGVPTLVLFLGIGMLAGVDGLGGITFDNPKVAQFIGIVSLNFILFSGGLDTNWSTIKPVLWQGVSLSTLGVLLTAVTTGIFVWLVTGCTIYEGMLLGAIVSSTDAAAVFSILRGKSLALKSKLRSTLEFESGSNDPMAYALTIVFLTLVMNPDMGLGSVIPFFLKQMLLGAAGGAVFAVASKFVINKIKLAYEGLYPVLMIGLMFITFSFTDFIGGNGFLAIYLCALYLGNQEIMHKRTIMKMYDGLAWLMQIVLFLTLGLLVNPSQIIPVIGLGLLVSVFLILVARPVAVFMSLLPFRMAVRKKFYISWVGLRGAVPIVFATYPLIAGIDKAGIIFNVVFFVALTSVIVQGTTLSTLAKWFHVALPENLKPLGPVEVFLSEQEKTAYAEVKIPEDSKVINKKIVDLNFPNSAIIAMIKRDGKYITPNGSTVINEGDVLVILCNQNNGMQEVQACLNINFN